MATRTSTRRAARRIGRRERGTASARRPRRPAAPGHARRGAPERRPRRRQAPQGSAQVSPRPPQDAHGPSNRHLERHDRADERLAPRHDTSALRVWRASSPGSPATRPREPLAQTLDAVIDRRKVDGDLVGEALAWHTERRSRSHSAGRGGNGSDRGSHRSSSLTIGGGLAPCQGLPRCTRCYRAPTMADARECPLCGGRCA